MPRTPMPLHPHTWSPDLVERVKALWLAGVSARSISATLAAEGIARSHSSVIGRMRRENVSFQGPGASRPPLARKPHEGPRKAPKALVVKAPPPPPKPAPRPAASDVLLPESRRVSILDVRDGVCRWIAGDPRLDPTACGHPADLGSPYCPAHRTVAPRSREAAYVPAFRKAA
ncbi:GcrA family cell cycle regulator [Methylobacterium sp. Leaf93]|uniref:GcrA family cell cycle regulator n=4 Tax=unclassified Methylobacterium TaxID=2615210 RepID=UPI000ABCDFA6|nr:GcrA family cell cycle regulator [Methylobacterium sp. Leaf93]